MTLFVVVVVVVVVVALTMLQYHCLCNYHSNTERFFFPFFLHIDLINIIHCRGLLRWWIQTLRTNFCYLKRKKKSHPLYICNWNRFYVGCLFVLNRLSSYPNIVFVFNGEEFPSKFSPSVNTLGNFQTSGCMAVMPQDLFSLKEMIE